MNATEQLIKDLGNSAQINEMIRTFGGGMLALGLSPNAAELRSAAEDISEYIGRRLIGVLEKTAGKSLDDLVSERVNSTKSKWAAKLEEMQKMQQERSKGN